AAPDLAAWREGLQRVSLGALDVEGSVGGARTTLPAWEERANAWYLDGFSPAKNPELWGDNLLQAVGKHTAPSGTAATYTAAGFVRRALAAAGFAVTRQPGFGRKRHMTVARMGE
ncbi:MAG TPA: FAD-dependent oxidoreductase, partial [Rhodobacterales bacterium]|nr:FAD-dependent oxidoreductase [Rhodobacterales bacterium]